MKKESKPTRAKLKKEYVTSNISTRALANKYGMSPSTLFNWCKQDHWTDERKIYHEKKESKTEALIIAKQEQIKATNDATEELALDITVSSQAEFQMKLYHSADLLFGKINEILAMDVPLAPRDLKSISSTLLDLKMMRITDANEDAKDDKTVVEFIDMDWSDSNA